MLYGIHQLHNSKGSNNYNAFMYADTDWATHFHKNLELICVIKDHITLTVNENELSLHEGEWAMILSNQIHSFSIRESAKAWVAVFSEDFVPEFAAYIRDKQGSSVRFTLDKTVEAFVREHLILAEPSTLMRKACLCALCDCYLKTVTLEPRRSKNDSLICNVLDYVEAHYCEDISLRSVAEAFGYEYHYLSRLLNKSYNVRFKQLVNEYRVQHAISLLKMGGQSMTEISMICGFQSIRSFNEVFRSVTGYTPSQYVERVLSEKI